MSLMTPAQKKLMERIENRGGAIRRANVGTTTVEARIGRITVPSTRYTARIGRETLMRKDGKPRTFLTREAALRAAERRLETQSN